MNTQNKTFYPKRHYPEPLPTFEADHRNCVKTFYNESNGKKFEEFVIEKELGPKNRIRSLSQLRNGLPVKIPGEKSYKNPEYSNNFFQEGGLVPGSTNGFNYHKTVSRKNYYFYETLDLNAKTLNPKKLWSYKQKKEDLDYDYNYVKMLKIWDKTVGKELTHATNTTVGTSKTNEPAKANILNMNNKRSANATNTNKK